MTLPNRPMRLVLFDIDGTLLTDRGASREAFADALAEVYGYDGDLDLYDFSGRTDPQITHMVLGDAGYERFEIEAALPRLWDHYLRGLEAKLSPGTIEPLPGIGELLAALEQSERVALALLTGNIERGARLKLAGASLNHYFPFGAFGSDSPDRTELPPIATRRAMELLGFRAEADDVVIVGDSIYDVRCGAPYQATTVAIASGRTPLELLLAENPTHGFTSAEDLEAVFAAIVGEPGPNSR